MARRHRIVFDRIWVRSSCEAGISRADLLTCGRSRSSPNAKRNKQDETFVDLPLRFVAEIDVIL
jgi:hypothetical protein